MAEEDIEISELEIKEELSSDDLLVVESALTTFATTLGRIRDWLKQFFVSLSENQTIFGEKTFSVSPLVPTPSVDDSSKKSANTEWVTNILNELYPVGSTYMTFNNSCPFNSLGIGTWELETTGVYVGTTNKVPVYGENDECLKLKFKGAGDSPYVAGDGVYNMISSKYTHDSNIDGLTLGTDNIARVRAQGKVNIISKEESISTNTPSTAYADMESKQIYIFKRKV